VTRIRVEGATVVYGRTRALDACDLTVEPGELLTVLGPSGCGKSTLLRVIAGLVAVDEGRIFFDDQEVTKRAPAAREVAMVFQGYALYPHLDVRSNIGFGLRARKVADNEVGARVERAAGQLGLADVLDRLPHQLSGGERQRVALARALVREPRAFLLDEPLSNLDAPLRHAARTQIALLQRETGRTMIHVTHDQAEAMSIGDRVAILRDGAVRQIGTPTEIYRNPVDTFVASFIGAPPMNLLRAERWGGSSDTIFGIRPEQVQLGSGPDSIGVVETVERLGDHSIITVEAGGETIRARAEHDTDIAVGARVSIGFDMASVKRFDASTGAAC
jgi:multiple sugar transport system ATP-binding protein